VSDSGRQGRIRTGRIRGLLITAAAVGVTAVMLDAVAKGLGTTDDLPPMATTVIVLGLAAAALQIAVRVLAPWADPVIVPIAITAVGLGLTMISRLAAAAHASAVASGSRIPRFDTQAQLAWLTVGVIGFVAVLWFIRDHRVLERYQYVCGFVGLSLLAIPLVLPASISEVNGAKNWIRLGPLSVQPGEFAKLFLVVFFAGYLVNKREALALTSRRVLGVALPRGRDIAPLIVAWSAAMAIMFLSKELGGSVLLFSVFIAMLYLATERRGWLLVGAGLVVVGGVVAYMTFSHVRLRFDIWLHAFDPAYSNASYQLRQGLFGMANGGLLGTGLGQGRPQSIPFAKTDFIVPAIGEELGLAGVLALLCLYLLLVARSMRTALILRDPFGKLLAGGLAICVAVQVFVVVGGVTRLIPLTGLTTPLVSYGGSSLVANFVLLGLLARISHAARAPQSTVAAGPPTAPMAAVGATPRSPGGGAR
jgi:cell division protein FtsW (lipid II flippase)